MLRLTFLLALLLPSALVAAQREIAAASGFYTMGLPAGWLEAQGEQGALLTADGIKARLLETRADSPSAAIELALAKLDIQPGSLISLSEAPLPHATWRQQIYAEGGQLFIALARARGERALVIIIEGEQAALQAINPQIVQWLSSIRFAETTLPDYVDAAAFSERQIQFGLPNFRLAGTLSVPVNPGPFAAVVIAHGSGPQNRDGLLGPLMPYRDMAQGLASRGTAVLRYDKRTFAHASAIKIDADFTVDSETTDDALLAADFLRGFQAIDPDRIFILGHSQGAALTPRMLRRDPSLAGGILLASPARPFSALLREQLAYIAELNPAALGSPAMENLRTMLGNFDRVAARASYEAAFGESAVYMRSLESIAPIAEARGLGAPLLILQGERDYQVTLEDFALWQAAFADQPNITLTSYPRLNHFFMAQGDLTRLGIPQDYARPDFVAPEVINDIANWIVKQGTAARAWHSRNISRRASDGPSAFRQPGIGGSPIRIRSRAACG